MKLFSLLLVVLMSGLLAQPSRLNIAVLDLDPTGIAAADAQFLSERLRTELFQTGAFQVVERDKMQEILAEQGFQNSGCTSVQCAVEIGELLNVQGIIAGALGKIDDMYSVSVRLIEVQTGAIMRTATRDFHGSLSEVLTEVIPQIAQEMAFNYQIEGAPARGSEGMESRWGLAFKLGGAFLGYTGTQNEAINQFYDSLGTDLDNFSNHSSVALEGLYTLNPDWQIKAGIMIQSMFSPWQRDFSVFPEKYESLHFERSYRFVNWYIGANYTFWRPNEKYWWYIGYDLGGTTLETEVSSSYKLPDGRERKNQEKYSYSRFTLKLDLGIGYMISKTIQAGIEMGTQITGDYDTSGENIPEDFPGVMTNILYPDQIVASGLRISLFLRYQF